MLVLFTLLILFSFSNAINIVPYISNGDEARITEFPYLVSIQRNGGHVCGGSLLSERWILSAARCLENRPYNELTAQYGTSEIDTRVTGVNKARISRGVTHENFNYSLLLNDISLLESETPMITGFHGAFAKLAPEGSQFRKGTKAVHTGWGFIQPNQSTRNLQKANLRMWIAEECMAAQTQVRLNTICAAAESVMCAGDPGNPLLINGVLVGVASLRNGPQCTNVPGEHPNVYTDISKYIEWIETHTGLDYQLSLFLERQQ